MKKIMFNDRYGLTLAVLEGRKTMTRRIVQDGTPLGNWKETIKKSRFKVGEVVAVAQSYKDAGIRPDMTITHHRWVKISPVYRAPRRLISDRHFVIDDAGYKNKMFVKADLMPHQIRIKNVRVERLKDISDEDCIREGIEEDAPYYWVPVNKSLPNWRKTKEGVSDMYPHERDGKAYPHFWDSPRKAFAALIDKLSGKGTWERNPWVFVYEFELIS